MESVLRGASETSTRLPDLADHLDAACLRESDDLSSVENESRLKDFKRLVKSLSNHQESLVDLQTRFGGKLETVKALRDGISLCQFYRPPLAYVYFHISNVQCGCSYSMQVLLERAELRNC